LPDAPKPPPPILKQPTTMDGLITESQAAFESARLAGLLKTSPLGAASNKGDDAFRHTYSSARASQSLTSPVANFLGRGNEWLAAATRENDDGDANKRDIGMDLWNNRAGREIAARLGGDATPEQLRDAVVVAANRGDLILSTKDPRALAEYQAQYDMRLLTGVHDAGAALRTALTPAATRPPGRRPGNPAQALLKEQRAGGDVEPQTAVQNTPGVCRTCGSSSSRSPRQAGEQTEPASAPPASSPRAPTPEVVRAPDGRLYTAGPGGVLVDDGGALRPLRSEERAALPRSVQTQLMIGAARASVTGLPSPGP
jgi:hypothetical protein